MSTYLQTEINMLHDLAAEKQKQLDELTKQYEKDIKELSAQKTKLEFLRETITTARPPEMLHEACQMIFGSIGWIVGYSDFCNHEHSYREYYLNPGLEPIILHLANDVSRERIGDLVAAHMKCWTNKHLEAKPILLIDSLDSDIWIDDIRDIAVKKDICLMTTGQLLSAYVQVDLHNYTASSLRNNITSTSGILHGYALIPSMEATGTTI